MPTSLFPSPLIDNHLYERNFFERIWPGLPPQVSGLDEAFDICLQLFQAHPNMDGYSENELEHKIIQPLLEKLGWHILTKARKTIAGVREEIDIVLFSEAET